MQRVSLDPSLHFLEYNILPLYSLDRVFVWFLTQVHWMLSYYFENLFNVFLNKAKIFNF